MQKFILSAGGTGGHVFPACALSVELRKNGIYTILITDQRGQKYVTNEFDKVVVLPIASLNWKYYLLSPWLFLKSLWHSKGVSETISFGGYTALFPVLASIFSFKRFYVVQLDSVITRFNRMFVKYAFKVFYVFPQTKFKKIEPNYYMTGMPVRNNFRFSFIGHSQSKFVISILGGSLGSDYWKDLILQFAQGLALEIRRSICLFVQTSCDTSFLNELEFQDIIISPFFDVAALLKKSHLVITRCGASILAEIATVARPIFLVPWLDSMEGHQLKNAENMVELGGCATGDYLSLLHFFSSLYSSEDFFISSCSKVAESLEINGKFNIIQHLLNKK